MPRILFLLKYRDVPYSDEMCSYGGVGSPGTPPSGPPLSSGLFNSARFVQEMLAELGFETAIRHAEDNNQIDRLVTEYRPDICIIEAFWVVPEKFAVLRRLHPKVVWVVRNHSATPFAATEGVVMDWSLRYMDTPGVILSCNDARTNAEFRALIATYKPDWSEAEIARRVAYLPNFYPPKFHPRAKPEETDFLNIACFGAIRPLKNHLLQASAAIKFAEMMGKTLKFHINSTRMEGRGEPVLHNLEKMFRPLVHELIEHRWMPHHDFTQLVRRMDIGMQVSFTETFNIVTADMVMNDVAVVVSPEITWVHPMFQADPTSSDSMIAALERAWWFSRNIPHWQPNVRHLREYDAVSVDVWQHFVRETVPGPHISL